MFIHISRASHSVFLSDGDYPEKLQFLSNINFCKVINIISLLVLAYLKVLLGGIKKISYLLHINLEYRHL